ncbi:hypothetical protein Bbelb_162730 [Branchiostoma belcheri]|nr:hypothetical protein Bbelb_162730 [Branchiostoma belcheri]
MAAALGERELIELSVFHKVEELTCSVCLDLFVTPKKLPCGHTFCLDCLQKHSAVKVLFSCPLCRLNIKIPPGGIPYLPSGRLDPNICGRIENPEKSEEKWIECRSFGGTGSQRGQFRGPRSLAVSDRGEIFVADYRNKRVQIFDFQGTFLSSFYTTLPGEEEDIYPYGVTLDSGGNIWVVGRAPSKPKSSSLSSSFALLDYCGVTTNSSHYNRERTASSSDFAVQYTRQGRYVIHFDVQNTRWAARGIAMDSRENNVVVTKVIEDGNSVVELFKPNGTLLRTIGDQKGWNTLTTSPLIGKGGF